MLVVFHEGPMDGVISTLEDHVKEVGALERVTLPAERVGKQHLPAVQEDVVTVYRPTGQRVLVGTAAWAMEFKPEGSI